MLDGVFVKTYSTPRVDEREIFRYAGQKTQADELLQGILKDCLTECLPLLSYRVCYAVGKGTDIIAALGNAYTGELVKRRLEVAEYAVVFGATVGLEIDRLIIRYGEISPTKALLLQAVGAERIESLCNVFCEDLQEEFNEKGLGVGARFSAGYGDFPLTAQNRIFQLLSPQRKIGLTLNESLLMSPTKSVTAIVPILRK